VAANDYFLSDFNGLAQISQDLMGQFNAMVTTQTDLKTRVNAALTDRQGPAYQEFQIAAARMDQSIQELSTILHQSSQFYDTSMNNGIATESQGIKGWSSVGA
jgi:uncharacterized protein YukE